MRAGRYSVRQNWYFIMAAVAPRSRHGRGFSVDFRLSTWDWLFHKHRLSESSPPGLSRGSTCSSAENEHVDGRNKSGHDGNGDWTRAKALSFRVEREPNAVRTQKSYDAH
jgi:hypothetical protein